MAAKPIIDIMVSTESGDHWPRLIDPIQSLGYFYWAEDDPEEMFFVKGMPPFGERRTHHVYVYEWDGIRWKKEISFRNYLCAQPEEARNYENLKRELAARFPNDRDSYTNGKTAYVKGVMGKLKLR